MGSFQLAFEPRHAELGRAVDPPDGLRHPRLVPNAQPLAYPAPTRGGVLAQPSRQHLLLHRSLGPTLDAALLQPHHRQTQPHQTLGLSFPVFALGRAAV